MLKFDPTSGQLVINSQQITSSLPNENQITLIATAKNENSRR